MVLSTFYQRLHVLQHRTGAASVPAMILGQVLHEPRPTLPHIGCFSGINAGCMLL